MKRLSLVACLLAAACHPVVEVAYAGEADAGGAELSCASPGPEEVLARVAGMLEEVIAKHTGYPPGYESNVRMAFQDILDEVHANVGNVRPPSP